MVWSIVLAGSLNEGKLKECSNAVNEAMIQIGNKYMIEYVITALKEARGIEKIIVAGPQKELAKIYGRDEDVYLVERGKTIIQSLLNALSLLPAEDVSRILVVTGDIPLITSKIIDDFLSRCSQEEADIIYPLVKKPLNEHKFPGVKRTYVYLKEGVVTGGNIILINPQIVPRNAQKAEDLVLLRKSPLRLAKYIGFRYIFKYLLRNLSLKEAEARVNELFQIKGKAIIVPYPEIGIDVDKPSDLELVRKVLA